MMSGYKCFCFCKGIERCCILLFTYSSWWKVFYWLLIATFWSTCFFIFSLLSWYFSRSLDTTTLFVRDRLSWKYSSLFTRTMTLSMTTLTSDHAIKCLDIAFDLMKLFLYSIRWVALTFPVAIWSRSLQSKFKKMRNNMLMLLVG